jgi:hypothetical protein
MAGFKRLPVLGGRAWEWRFLAITGREESRASCTRSPLEVGLIYADIYGVEHVVSIGEIDSQKVTPSHYKEP